MSKIALITGITGQDGSYLADLLLKKGYNVHGLVKPDEEACWRHNYLHIQDAIMLHECLLTDKLAVRDAIGQIKPDEIYNLAAQSLVSESIKNPEATLEFNIQSVEYLLESIIQIDNTIRFFHASSSEIFDPTATQPLTSSATIGPINPYGESKAANHLLVQNYRVNFNVFAVNGILFPHESPLRHDKSLIKTLIRSAKFIKDGGNKKIHLGQAENQRDFGNAREYVEAMWLSLQQNTARDYIISSGNPVSIMDITKYILKKFNLSEDVIKMDEALFQSPNIPIIYGDNTETIKILGWECNTSIYETIDSMIEFHIGNHQP